MYVRITEGICLSGKIALVYGRVTRVMCLANKIDLVYIRVTGIGTMGLASTSNGQDPDFWQDKMDLEYVRLKGDM